MARIYQCPTAGEAHLRAALVDHPGLADLCVKRVGSWGMAHGDTLWFITDNREDATVWIHFGSIGMSQVKICFVDNYSEVGWKRPHPLRGRF